MKEDRRVCTGSVRLQIPLGQDLAEEVAYLAGRMERSQAWLVARLLEEAVLDQERILGWLDSFVARAVGGTVRMLTGKVRRSRQEQDVVRLQVPVTTEVVEKVARLGERLNHSQVQMAALLIEWAMADQGWVIELVSSKWGKTLMAQLYGANDQVSGRERSQDGGDTDTAPKAA